VGCDATLPAAARADLTLFGEGSVARLVAVEARHAREFEGLMAESAIPWRWIGTTGGDRLVIRVGNDTVVDVDASRSSTAWRSGFERHMA